MSTPLSSHSKPDLTAVTCGDLRQVTHIQEVRWAATQDAQQVLSRWSAAASAQPLRAAASQRRRLETRRDGSRCPIWIRPDLADAPCFWMDVRVCCCCSGCGPTSPTSRQQKILATAQGASSKQNDPIQMQPSFGGSTDTLKQHKYTQNSNIHQYLHGLLHNPVVSQLLDPNELDRFAQKCKRIHIVYLFHAQ